MARYREATCRACRREGMKLMLKGARCNSPKCAQDRKPYPPGQGGETRNNRRRQSDYGVQLREKQKARQIYGILEKQFRAYVAAAERVGGVTGEVLLQLLERRLDNVVYRAGLAASRNEARQLVSHGHFTVNDGRMNIPSYQVRVGDVVKVRETSKQSPVFKGRVGQLGALVPQWLVADMGSLSVKVDAFPARDQIETVVEEQLIVEFYSR